jgi:hypothetical protein
VSQPPHPDAANYSKRREYALAKQYAEGLRPTVQIVLMEWHTPIGGATVLSAFDGAASVYMSDGSEFVGGGKSAGSIRDASLQAIEIAGRSLGVFQPATTTRLPEPGEVCFYIRSGAELLRAVATDKELRLGTAALTDLGDAMQNIYTQYRLHQPQQKPTP